jgi:hypothetical protein
LGGLNQVAGFVSILFLTLYVTINLSAAFEKMSGDPSYRPTINVPWYVSLLGSLGAVLVMFLISPIACFAALAFELLIYTFLRRRAMQKRWGDVRAGLWLALVRRSLLRLRGHENDPRNWRPHILVFAGDTAKRIRLVRLANWFNENRGIVTVCRLTGRLEDHASEVAGMRREIEQDLDAEGIVGFSEVNIVPDFTQGVISVAQANGIAGLHSNTVMFGWPEKEGRLAKILGNIRTLSLIGKNTIIARPRWSGEINRRKTIDIWWRGKQFNGDLMLLLTHLLTMNSEWRNSQVVIRSIISDESRRDRRETDLQALITETRIRADFEVIVKPENRTVVETIHATSKQSDVVFFGLMEPAEGEDAESAARLEELAEGLKTIIFVRNAGEFAGRLV